MKILITNDDGVFAPGIRALAEWAKTLGDVTVVAPKTEQSGKSHAINFTHPMEIKRVNFMDGVAAYSVDSTPADCVRFGIAGLKTTYDLVLSGINRGVNLGVDMIYSGTVAAVFEAAYWKHKAIAFSTYPETGAYAASKLNDVYKYIEGKKLFDYADIYNVNIPENPKGILITRQGSPYFDDGFQKLPGENDLYIQTGEKTADENPDDETLDTVATENGYISITPLTLSRVNEKAYNILKNLKN